MLFVYSIGRMFVSFKKNASQRTLWERYVRGDKSAFGELYTYYHKSLTAFCMGRLKTIELAENAASETLIKLLQYERPSEIENFESWLFTVAKNECNTNWSTTERRKKILEDNYETINSYNPEAEEKLAIESIDRIIKENLDDIDYKIWQLYQQGYDNHEIAEMTGLNEKTTANRKSAARNKLKLALKDFNSRIKNE